jgi:hypothetical protein
MSVIYRAYSTGRSRANSTQTQNKSTQLQARLRALNEEKNDRYSMRISTHKELNKIYKSPTRKEDKNSKNYDDSEIYVKSSYENNLYGDIKYKQYDLYDDDHYVQLKNETVSVPSVSSLSVCTTEMKSGSYMRGTYIVICIYIHIYAYRCKYMYICIHIYIHI